MRGIHIRPARVLNHRRETEIEHLDLAFRRDLDICRLEVAVNHPSLVRRFERRGDLFCDRHRLVERQGAICEPIRQCRAFDQFHHDRADAIRLFEAVDGGDVRMIQRGERLRFPLETHQAIGSGGEEFGQDLQRNIATEPGVACLVDLAHAARAERGEDFVRAKACAGSEGHEAFRISRCR